MPADYEIWLLHPAYGYPLALVSNYESLEYVKVTNGLGAFTLTLPSAFDLSLVQQDTRVVVYRTPVGGVKKIDFVGFVESKSRQVAGAERITEWRNERNYAYAGGQGEESLRVIEESSDANRVGASPFNRREIFVDARNETDANAVLAAAQAAVRDGRPTNTFTTQISRNASSDAEHYVIAGYDLNSLLNRRIIAYAAGSAQAEKTDQADDLVKAIVRENLGSLATDTTRDLSANGLTVQTDLGLATSLTKGFSWRNVLTTLQEIADASHATEATSVYFGMVPTNLGFTCEFRTNIQQWGSDHRFQIGTQSAVVFSPETNEQQYVYGRDYEHGDYVSAFYFGELLHARIETINVKVSGQTEDVSFGLKSEAG